jgi:hypothetical protein
VRASLLLKALPMLLLFACSGEPGEEPAAEPGGSSSLRPADPLATPAPLPPQVADYPALESPECREVAQFYLAAVEQRDFAPAALVWNDPVIDAARLEALFADYGRPLVTIGEVTEEGAAGSLYCTVTGVLTDAADPAKPASEGMLELRRVNNVPGATPDQLRWTIRRSTFVESMERSARG